MSRQTIFAASVKYFLEPIGQLLEDESVTEIMVNGFDEVDLSEEEDAYLKNT